MLRILASPGLIRPTTQLPLPGAVSVSSPPGTSAAASALACVSCVSAVSSPPGASSAAVSSPPGASAAALLAS